MGNSPSPTPKHRTNGNKRSSHSITRWSTNQLDLSRVECKSKGIIFDKDGTLFDFRTTWDVWSWQLITLFAKGDPTQAKAIATAAHYDLDNQRFLPTSPSLQVQIVKRQKYLLHLCRSYQFMN